MLLFSGTVVSIFFLFVVYDLTVQLLVLKRKNLEINARFQEREQAHRHQMEMGNNTRVSLYLPCTEEEE